MKKFYFAYGSNMDQNQMNSRCPNPKLLGVAILKGYKFVYDGCSYKRKGAVANIVESPDEIVYGALYEISINDEKRLDNYEGYCKSYDKKTVKVKDSEGREYEAMVYYRYPKEEGLPSNEYENIVVNAGRKLGLPEDYIEKYLKVNR